MLPQYAFAHTFTITDGDGNIYESQVIHAKDEKMGGSPLAAKVRLKFANPNIISDKTAANVVGTVVKPVKQKNYESDSRNISVHSNGQYFLVKANIPENSFIKFSLKYQELLKRYRGFYRYSATWLSNIDTVW